MAGQIGWQGVDAAALTPFSTILREAFYFKRDGRGNTMDSHRFTQAMVLVDN